MPLCGWRHSLPLHVTSVTPCENLNPLQKAKAPQVGQYLRLKFLMRCKVLYLTWKGWNNTFLLPLLWATCSNRVKLTYLKITANFLLHGVKNENDILVSTSTLSPFESCREGKSFLVGEWFASFAFFCEARESDATVSQWAQVSRPLGFRVNKQEVQSTVLTPPATASKKWPLSLFRWIP